MAVGEGSDENGGEARTPRADQEQESQDCLLACEAQRKRDRRRELKSELPAWGSRHAETHRCEQREWEERGEKRQDLAGPESPPSLPRQL